jgi:hypothetical protein
MRNKFTVCYYDYDKTKYGGEVREQRNERARVMSGRIGWCLSGVGKQKAPHY